MRHICVHTSMYLCCLHLTQRADPGRASSDMLDGDVWLPSAGHSGPCTERWGSAGTGLQWRSVWGLQSVRSRRNLAWHWVLCFVFACQWWSAVKTHRAALPQSQKESESPEQSTRYLSTTRWDYLASVVSTACSVPQLWLKSLTVCVCMCVFVHACELTAVTLTQRFMWL